MENSMCVSLVLMYVHVHTTHHSPHQTVKKNPAKPIHMSVVSNTVGQRQENYQDMAPGSLREPVSEEQVVATMVAQAFNPAPQGRNSDLQASLVNTANSRSDTATQTMMEQDT